MAIEISDDFANCAVRICIWVEKKNVLCLSIGQSLVVRPGEAQIFLIFNQSHSRKMLLHHLCALIDRCVIYYPDFRVDAFRFAKRKIQAGSGSSHTFQLTMIIANCVMFSEELLEG